MSFLGLGCRYLISLRAPAFGFGVLFVLMSWGTAFSQEPRCSCDFANPPWKAYGTHAACTAYTRKRRTSCEISFAGLGASNNLISRLLNEDPGKYESQVYKLATTYLMYLRQHNTETLTNPKFLTEVLPIFARGAYLRGSLDTAKANGVMRLDTILGAFFKAHSKSIGDVFSGREKPFVTKKDDATIFVGKGFITTDYDGGRLIMAYLP